MTYALAWPLQEALYSLFTTDAACVVAFDGRVHDGPPPLTNAEAEGAYLVLGDEEARDWSTKTDDGAVHLVRVDVHVPRRGFGEAKRAAAAVSDAMLTGPISPARGHVVNARFVDARTEREENDALRRIRLQFRITLEDTQ
ncbi:MAG: DUF3168 domain-containing protein [Paracoccaceae bacterium]